MLGSQILKWLHWNMEQHKKKDYKALGNEKRKKKKKELRK